MLVDVFDTRVDGRGIRRGVCQGGFHDAEENVGVGSRDAVEVFVLRFTGGRRGAGGYCVVGVEVAFTKRTPLAT